MDYPLIIGILVALIFIIIMYELLVPKSTRGLVFHDENAFNKNPIMKGFAAFGNELYTALPEGVQVGNKERYPLIEELIVKSGNPWNINAREYKMMQIVLAVVGAIVGVALWASLYFAQGLTWLPWWACILAGTGLGYITPHSKYKEQANLRDLEFRRQLPEALDLLIITVASGATVVNGMKNILPDLQPGVVKEEFKNIVTHVESGGSFDAALENLALRAPNDGVETFVRALQEANKRGSDTVEILESRAEESRKDFFTLLEKKVATLSSRVFMILTPTLMPAVMIIAIAPSAASLAESLG